MTVTETARGVLTNPALRPHALRPPAAEAVRAFHATLPGYRPTRLVDAPVLARRLGVATVSVKDESQRLGMPSFKILGASWATFRALCEHTGADHTTVGGLDGLRARMQACDLTLVAATDGNHGRAVARVATLLGLRAHILVPQDMVPARIAAIRGENAAVTVVDGTYDAAVARSAELSDDHHLVVSDTSWPGYERIPAWVIEGYATIAREIGEQIAGEGTEPPTLVSVQIGVGAFAAAMVRSYVPAGARVVGVEPTRAACALESVRAGHLVDFSGPLDSIMAGLNCGTPSPVAWPTVRAGIGSFVAVTDADAEDAMRALAGVGVVSGESGAAGLAGLLAAGAQLDLRSDDRVLVVSTEGATDPDAYRRIVGTDPKDVPASEPT